MLVDYGSDDDSGSEAIVTPPAPTSAAAGPSKPASGLFSSLPPAGRGKLGLALPVPSASKPASAAGGLALPPPKKRGPVKIVLDANAATRPADDEEAERARKRARTAMSGSGGGLKGLAGMLPAPKAAPTTAAPTQPAPAAEADDAERAAIKAMLGDGEAAPAPSSVASTAFVPHTTTKGKARAPVQAAAATDFFSLGSASTAVRLL